MGANMQTLPLENVTNILNSASSLLPQTSTKPLPRDPVTGAIIRPRDEEGNLIYYDV